MLLPFLKGLKINEVMSKPNDSKKKDKGFRNKEILFLFFIVATIVFGSIQIDSKSDKTKGI